VIVILVVLVSDEMLVILYGAFGMTHIRAPLPEVDYGEVPIILVATILK